MIAVDTNVLVYAVFSGFKEHRRAAAWLKHLAEGPRPWGLPIFCITEFIRVDTHPKVMSVPLAPDEAWKIIESLVQSPSARVLMPGAGFLQAFADLMKEDNVKGNLVFDAQVAGLCLEHGISRLLTEDRDFSRIHSLKTIRLSEPLS